MLDQNETMLPLVEIEVAVHRSGFGIFNLGYLSAVPGPGLSEDEVRESINHINLTVTEQTCAQLVELLTELTEQMAKLKPTRN